MGNVFIQMESQGVRRLIIRTGLVLAAKTGVLPGGNPLQVFNVVQWEMASRCIRGSSSG